MSLELHQLLIHHSPLLLLLCHKLLHMLDLVVHSALLLRDARHLVDIVDVELPKHEPVVQEFKQHRQVIEVNSVLCNLVERILLFIDFQLSKLGSRVLGLLLYLLWDCLLCYFLDHFRLRAARGLRTRVLDRATGPNHSSLFELLILLF